MSVHVAGSAPSDVVYFSRISFVSSFFRDTFFFSVFIEIYLVSFLFISLFHCSGAFNVPWLFLVETESPLSQKWHQRSATLAVPGNFFVDHMHVFWNGVFNEDLSQNMCNLVLKAPKTVIVFLRPSTCLGLTVIFNSAVAIPSMICSTREAAQSEVFTRFDRMRTTIRLCFSCVGRWSSKHSSFWEVC